MLALVATQRIQDVPRALVAVAVAALLFGTLIWLRRKP